MRLFEYQAKELFAEHGIPLPTGKLIEQDAQLEDAIHHVNLPCVIKAQVLEGGRGKAGLIQAATSLEDAYQKIQYIYQKRSNIKKILVEEEIDATGELYLSITVDPVSGSALIMACREGGVDIEEIARTAPETIVREYVDLNIGLSAFQARDLMFSLGLDSVTCSHGAIILEKMFEIFCKYEAELVEINPLMICKDGSLLAADGKITLDDNSLYRHNRFRLTQDYFDSNDQYEAALEGIPLLQFNGDIGIMCAGAGLTNTVFDLVHDYGGTVASYLEFGGPNYRKAMKALTLMLNTNPKCILIATFGTIARADVMAEGISEAISKLKPEIPIVTVIRGTGEERATEILRNVGLKSLHDTEEAVQKAVELAGGIR